MQVCRGQHLPGSHHPLHAYKTKSNFTAATLVSKNKETAAMLLFPTNIILWQPHSFLKYAHFFRPHKFTWLLAT